MVSIEQMEIVLRALPDPAFILSRSGKYVAVFGGLDARYYHESNGLVGLCITDMVAPDKAAWFLQQIGLALSSKALLINEYELSIQEVNSGAEAGPEEPIWFEGRIQSLDFQVDGEDVVLWVASNITERHEMETQLRILSDTDKLTGLFNRRKLEIELAQHYENFHLDAAPLSVVMFDLDNLKTINDTLGHYVGDEMLIAVGQICRTELNSSEFACRFGGDEFVIGLPNFNLYQAEQCAARLHASFNAYFHQFFSNIIATTIGVSMGVSTLLNSDQCYEDVLKRADDALYKAKRSGKNRAMTG